MIWWMALLFMAGMVLVFSEFILPGAILGVAGAILLFICAALGFANYPEYAILIVVAEMCGVAISIGVGMYLMAKTDLGKSLRLEKSQSEEDGFIASTSDLSLIGKTGTVLTALRPAGSILIEGMRLDAVSSGEFIDKDAEVCVTEVHGNRIVVEKAS